MAGVDGVTTERFGRDLVTALSRVSDALRSRTYEPQPLLRLTIRERIGKERRLGVPTVRDRVVQRAFLSVLGGRLRAASTDASFAYRRGRSWLDALRRAEECRDAGLRWVYRADIEAFFETIDHRLLAGRVARLCRDDEAERIVMDWATAPVVTPDGIEWPAAGVPQGAPISPALANHFLSPFDEAVDGRRGRLVRFADDLAVFCADVDTAECARADVESALAALRLRPNPSKSYVSSFDRGFSFLGWVFFGEDGFEEEPGDGWTHPMTVGRRRGRSGGRADFGDRDGVW